MRRLPPELLLYIFQFACDTSRPLDTFDQDTFLTPIRLLQTCRQWRAIGNSTPTLWTCIHIHNYKSLIKQRAVIRLFLIRSNDCDLHIKIGVGARLVSESDMRVMLTELLQTCNRWRSFHSADFSADEATQKLALHAVGALHLPRVERVAVHRINAFEQLLPLEAIFLFAPRLRALDLGGVDRTWKMIFPLIPPGVRALRGAGAAEILTGAWPAAGSLTPDVDVVLTHAVAGLPELMQAHNPIFPRAAHAIRALTTLTIDPQRWTREVFFWLGLVVIPTLRDLTLIVREDACDCLRTPPHVQRTQPRPRAETPIMARIGTFVGRSRCSLAALHVVMKRSDAVYRADQRRYVHSSADLLPILLASPALATLHLVESAPVLLDSKLFESLNMNIMMPAPGVVLLPNLRHVKFVWMPAWCGREMVAPRVQKLLVRFLKRRTGRGAVVGGGVGGWGGVGGGGGVEGWVGNWVGAGPEQLEAGRWNFDNNTGSHVTVARLETVVIGCRMGAEVPRRVTRCLDGLREKGVQVRLW